MKKQLSFPIHPLLAAVIVVGAFFALLFAIYGLNRWASSGEVMGNVQVAESQLGGKTEGEALDTVGNMESVRLARIVHFTVDGNEVDLEPGYTGFKIDEQAIVDEAMSVGRSGNFANQFLHWLTHMFETTEIPLEGEVSDMAMGEIFDEWDTQVIDKPINMGSIELVDGELVAVYPSTGVGVDREPAQVIVLDTILSANGEIADIPTMTVVPQLTQAEVDEALVEAETMLSAPVSMTYDGKRAILTVDQLKEAFQSETITNSPPQIVNSFDPVVVDAFLEPLRDEFEAEPVDARYLINDDLTVSIEPGVNGTRIDEVETAQRLYDASLSDDRTGELPIVEGAEPDVTTQELEDLNVKHLVAQFTTYYDCCPPRVTNIQKIADAVDRTLVRPGEVFSLNGHVGERTLEKGYVDAGSIVSGEIVDTIGGGTSQFTTTLYNAVFWGGYEDVEHQPHSYYFSRYPEGVEATLFWQSIDLKFRNNRESGVLIDTTYNDNSVTVRFFGFNHGRTLVGDHRSGQTNVRVASEGGPEALHVKGETSDRFAISQPREPVIRANPELGLNQQKQIQGAAEGWSVRVTRRILKGGTDLVEEQTWEHRYRAQFEIIEVHPCKVPGTSVACPTTTTATTAPPATTTTTAGATTTTSGGTTTTPTEP